MKEYDIFGEVKRILTPLHIFKGPRRRWTEDIKDWTELPVAECVRTAQDRTA